MSGSRCVRMLDSNSAMLGYIPDKKTGNSSEINITLMSAAYDGDRETPSIPAKSFSVSGKHAIKALRDLCDEVLSLNNVYWPEITETKEDAT